MFDENKTYKREEIFGEIQRYGSPYNGYKVIEKNYKKHNNRSVVRNCYKVVDILDDASMLESAREIYQYNGIIIVEMVFPEK